MARMAQALAVFHNGRRFSTRGCRNEGMRKASTVSGHGARNQARVDRWFGRGRMMSGGGLAAASTGEETCGFGTEATSGTGSTRADSPGGEFVLTRKCSA